MGKKKMKEGFTCECGKYHYFGVYVAAHWRETLDHTCDCGRKHSVLSGNVKLINKKANPAQKG